MSLVSIVAFTPWKSSGFSARFVIRRFRVEILEALFSSTSEAKALSIVAFSGIIVSFFEKLKKK